MQSWRRDGAGVAFSTWPDGWTQVWPGWLSEIALGFLFAVGLAAWICWAILARLRADSAASPSADSDREGGGVEAALAGGA